MDLPFSSNPSTHLNPSIAASFFLLKPLIVENPRTSFIAETHQLLLKQSIVASFFLLKPLIVCLWINFSGEFMFLKTHSSSLLKDLDWLCATYAVQ